MIILMILQCLRSLKRSGQADNTGAAAAEQARPQLELELGSGSQRVELGDSREAKREWRPPRAELGDEAARPQLELELGDRAQRVNAGGG